MFDISSGELGVIAVVALIVLGPERLPKAARVAGAMLRKARLAYTEVRDQVERELNAEELKQQMAAARAGIDEVTKPVNDALRDTDTALRDAGKAAQAELDGIAAQAAAATGPDSAGAESAMDGVAPGEEDGGGGAAEPPLELPLEVASSPVTAPAAEAAVVSDAAIDKAPEERSAP